MCNTQMRKSHGRMNSDLDFLTVLRRGSRSISQARTEWEIRVLEMDPLEAHLVTVTRRPQFSCWCHFEARHSVPLFLPVPLSRPLPFLSFWLGRIGVSSFVRHMR